MPTEPRPPVSRRKLGMFGGAAVIAALMLVISGIRAREDSSARLREWTDSQAVPPVAVIFAESGALTATIDLPGRLEAYYRAPIFAQLVDVLARHPHRFRKFALRQVERLHELLDQNFANARRLTLGHQHHSPHRQK